MQVGLEILLTVSIAIAGATWAISWAIYQGREKNLQKENMELQKENMELKEKIKLIEKKSEQEEYIAKIPIPSKKNNGEARVRQAYLIGEETGTKKVNRLVKIHDFQGKAIYIYDLLKATRTQEADSSTPDISVRIRQYRTNGYEVEHPEISYKNTSFWIEHALTEAKRLGLEVG